MIFAFPMDSDEHPTIIMLDVVGIGINAETGTDLRT